MRLTLSEWLARAIEASYPISERWEVAQAADAYLAWLDSLPEVEQ